MSFLSGVALVLNEVLIQGTPSNTVMIFGAFLMGLPAIMRVPKEEKVDWTDWETALVDEWNDMVKEIDPPARPKITRDTDLRIVAKLPPVGIEKQIAKDMKRLEKLR